MDDLFKWVSNAIAKLEDFKDLLPDPNTYEHSMYLVSSLNGPNHEFRKVKCFSHRKCNYFYIWVPTSLTI